MPQQTINIRPSIIMQTGGTYTASVGLSGADYNVADTNNAQVSIETVISDWNISGQRGVIFIKEGTYNINAEIDLYLNDITIKGAGIDLTTLKAKSGVAYGSVFVNKITTGVATAIDNVWIEDMTIDLDNLANTSGISWLKNTNCGFRRVKFVNGGTNGWLARICALNNLTDGIVNSNITVEDCIFDTHAGTLEMLLLGNINNAKIKNPYFTNKVGNNPVLGLWQKATNIEIDGMTLKDTNGYNYYSTTCSDIVTSNTTAINAGEVWKGANDPDSYTDSGNDPVWLEQTNNITINGLNAIGGANSSEKTCIQFGGMDSGILTNFYIEGYTNPVIVNKGNSNVSDTPNNILIKDGIFKNNNPDNNVHLYHPAIWFKEVGAKNVIIDNVIFTDTRTPRYQRYPIVFSGAFTYDYIRVTNSRLQAGATYDSIVLDAGATLTNTYFYNNFEVTKGSLASYYEEIEEKLDKAGGTISGNLTVTGDLTVNGTTTTLNTSVVDIEDTNITLNKNGTNGSAEGGGITIERPGGNARIIHENTATTKFKLGVSGAEIDIADISTAQTFLNKKLSSAGSLTSGSAIQIGSGGATEYLQFGDSVKIRGNAGHTEFFPTFSAKEIRFHDSSNNKTSHINSDNGSYSINTAGGGLAIKEGSNATMGVATLVAGTVTISTTKVTANSRIQLTNNGVAGTEYGLLAVSSRSAGTSFTITSYRGNNTTTVASGDTSSVAWVIIEPS